MKAEHKTNFRKNLLQLAFFLAMMLLTFYAIFHNNNISEIWADIRSLTALSLVCAVFCAVFFVCAEGFMIWYLLRLTQDGVSLLRCFGYSFIGFFFSGITPSATGGQPAQLYFMKKDKISLGSSTLTLMTVALLYKLVLVFIGIGLLLFWRKSLAGYLGSYMPLFYIGIALNAILVTLLLLIMYSGTRMKRLLFRIEEFLIRIHILKPSAKRKEAFRRLIADYQSTLHFFSAHKLKILFVTLCTLLQRCSLFTLTYFIYTGLGLNSYPLLLIMALQASVYIGVDMLPLPGSQGISELMYHAVFTAIFTGGYLPASMCITRGISFYLPLIIGALTFLLRLRRQVRIGAGGKE